MNFTWANLSKPVGLMRIVFAFVPFVALLAYGLWSFPLATFGPERERIPGDLRDARFNNYILEHYHAYATGRIDDYWDAPFMYPYKNVIAFSDNLLGTAPLYSLFRSIGYNRESAFQFWILTLFALNYLCCFLALWAWAKRPLLAAGGAFIFAFGIYMIGHMEHAQMFPKFMIPIAFLLCWKWLNTGRLLHVSLLAIAVVYQFYCGIYLGFMLCYGLFFLVLAYVLFNFKRAWQERGRSWRPYLGFVTIIVGGALLLIPLMQPYLEISAIAEPRDFNALISTVPRPASYFFTHPAALSWRSLSEHAAYSFDDWWCHFHFMGALPWIAVLLIPVVLWKYRERAQNAQLVAIVGSAMFLSIIFCLRIGDFTLYSLIFALPGFSAMRSIDRVVHVQAFYFALITVLVFAQFGKKEWSRMLIGLTIVLLIVLENKLDMTKLRSFNKYDAQGMVDRIVLDMELQRDSAAKAIAYMPVRSVMPYEEDHVRSIELHLNSMLAGQQLGVPVVNAYTCNYPGNYMKFWEEMNELRLIDWCRFNGINLADISSTNNLRRSILRTDTIRILASNGQYVCVDLDHEIVVANRPEADLRETFVRSQLMDGRYCFLSHTGKFLGVRLYGDSSVIAGSDELGDMALFRQVQNDDGTFSFLVGNGVFIELNKSTKELSARDTIPDEQCRFRIERVFNTHQ
ncbi:MAG: hypothetical protein IPI00_09775 [Flavobacteriales bacterium]|nr:hypothetical protein [Flavobacteriales bacterium]MBK6944253.1 hypothetical protein [Flavobacteriales bacterium]MBK7240454.1 hypothetical protein [Flavobacteriales bacterium]MBK7295253.1 hypothetical protein [Flavobacteriales bacterium]MBK9533919.1 hypothetical protein [Flavobacteriales bacterium]